MKINLYKETMRRMETKGKTLEDIDWVGGYDFTIPLDNFIEVAKNTDYNPAYGIQEVASDLTIMFKDGSYLYRDEYDGSEWWEYYAPRTKPGVHRMVDSLDASQAAKNHNGGYWDYAGQMLYDMNEFKNNF